MPRILAIDPGTLESGYVIFEDGKIIDKGIEVNELLRDTIKIRDYDTLVIEMVASYGMPVGKEVFETCLWIGRFIECTKRKVKLIERRDVKLHLCKNATAKDSNIRQAVIDKYGGDSKALAGKKCSCKNGETKTKIPKPCLKCNATGWIIQPGPLYYVSSHEWAALGLALTASNQ